MRQSLTMAAVAALALAVAALAPAAAQDRRERGDGRPDGRSKGFVEMLDADHDGRVSLAEILAEQSRLFAAVDVDKDGALSVEEFRRRGNIIARFTMTTLFDLLDADGDRNVTAEELAGPTRRWQHRYDTDGDGALAPDELPARGGPHR